MKALSVRAASSWRSCSQIVFRQPGVDQWFERHGADAGEMRGRRRRTAETHETQADDTQGVVDQLALRTRQRLRHQVSPEFAARHQTAIEHRGEIGECILQARLAIARPAALVQRLLVKGSAFAGGDDFIVSALRADIIALHEQNLAAPELRFGIAHRLRIVADQRGQRRQRAGIVSGIVIGAGDLVMHIVGSGIGRVFAQQCAVILHRCEKGRALVAAACRQRFLGDEQTQIGNAAHGMHALLRCLGHAGIDAITLQRKLAIAQCDCAQYHGRTLIQTLQRTRRRCRRRRRGAGGQQHGHTTDDPDALHFASPCAAISSSNRASSKWARAR